MRRSDPGPGWTLVSLFWLGQLVLVATLGCQERPASKEEVIAPSGLAVTAGTPAGYVEDRACGASGCHDELYRSFLETDKGKSFHRPGPDRVIEDIETSQFFHEPSQRYYQVIRRDDRFVFRRYQLDDRGEPINELEQEIDWVQGAGAHTRLFLYRTPSGEIFQLPFVWYAEDREWGMAPGFDRVDHEGIQRRVRRGCLFCHNAYPDLQGRGDAFDAPHVYPAELPEGIGCQRCHGPGAEHTRLALTGSVDEDELRDSILDPGWLPTDLLNDLCYQCHARRSQVNLVRFGRGDFSFQPGEPLSEYLVQVDATEKSELDVGRTPTYPHFMMEQSRCFIESDGRMSCITCHESHRKVPESQQTAYYLSVCNRCHPQDESHLEGLAPDALLPGADAEDCVACHMPKRPTRTARLSLSDHSIPRRPDYGGVVPKRDDEDDIEYVDFRVVDLDGELGQLYRAVAAVEAEGGIEAVEHLASMIVLDTPEQPEPILTVARGLLQHRRSAAAQSALAILMARDPENLLALEYLGIAKGGLGQPDEAIAVFRQLLEHDPNRAKVRFDLGLLLMGSGRVEEAVAELERAVALRPNLVLGWYYLGTGYTKLNRLEEAVERYRQALAVEPSYRDAYLGIGKVLLRQGNRAEALRYLRHGARAARQPQAIAEALAIVLGDADTQQRRVD